MDIADPGQVQQRHLRILALPAFRRRTANPFQALLYERVQTRNVEVREWSFARALWARVDLWHLHHPDTVVFPRRLWQSLAETVLFRLLLLIARWRGIRILWTVHDLDSSDGLHPRLEAWFWSYFLPRIDGYVCLSASGRRLALQRFPALARLPGFLTPHGHFRDAYPNEVTREEARRLLDLPARATVLLHVGLIRPYKDVPRLIRTFLDVMSADVLLVIAGRAHDPGLEAEIRALAAGCPRIRLFLRWIGFEETQHFFAACDLVVLPYRRILNSGTLMLALSFRRPVLVPDRGALREQQERFGDDWVRLYANGLDPDDLDQAAVWARSTARRPLDFSGLDWDTLARQTRHIYDAVLAA
jgi:beta-1,4-mannosyltransferase